MSRLLSKEQFKTVVESTPLISLDLVVRDQQGKVLLGKRLNRPAKGYWFVPGGRVLKNEALADAFQRLTLNELGQSYTIDQARYLGLYEHFYEDAAVCELVSTHYVVNAFLINLGDTIRSLPEEQHSEYRWLREAELLEADDVHLHSKWYFMNGKGYSK
ncbi:GDP-mannose mannosyl hydrolase [Amphritea balenae]|uniref:GDP-mannose mannosyl hydrolase n=1 Tax=Amphritea balenae TaxID=452629 RepID=A0A3P1SST0_9GAMM|nr:GDP-mannose mannosyl hydrolase [Amphritea balenae]RRD00191.1 GDP-mannose mannosyl hydrolase [Amphritea balenae]GGK77442.1 GDP-mannose mannosyl hydrolase WbdQ/WbhG [Amphritea balenae]